MHPVLLGLSTVMLMDSSTLMEITMWEVRIPTWALVPPIPNEFILARLLRFFGQGIALVGTSRRYFPKATSGVRQDGLEVSSGLLLGFGVLNLIFGGIVSCCRESMTLIRLVIPDAPSEWPTLGLT